MDITAEQREALDIAASMIKAGIPVFAAPPCPAAHGGTCTRPGHTGKEEYDLPGKWQLTVPSTVNLEKWQPGWALGAVGGHLADFLDMDPRNGGETSMAELEAAGQWPRVFGVQQTPSGGFHYVISPLGEHEANGFMPGLDYQGGTPEGKGRAFVFIAPTVKRSKAAENAGQRCTYRWLELPDLDYLAEFDSGDDSTEGVRDRLAAYRERKNSKAAGPDNREAREFTEDQARMFCDLTIKPLTEARVGEIEERANAAAAQLSHFTPDFWSPEFAHTLLTLALEQTAYDPEHPAAGWTADKFWPVLRHENDRAPDDWKAVRVAASVAEVVAEPDEVDALIAEMLTPGQVEELPPPRHLIRDVLTLDSESWLIGGPGSKKSFVALDMAARVSLGQDWQGRATVAGSVVYIVAEGAAGSGKRVKAWQKEHGQMGRVMFLPRPVQAKNMKAWATLVEACRRIGPVMVILDTQARVTVGLEENSATDLGYYIEAVRALREATGACVLTIHHTGRRGQDARGTSALDGAQSTELTMVPDANSPLLGQLKITKQKDIEEGAALPLRFRKVDLELSEHGEPVDSLVLCPPSAFDAAQVAPELIEDWETGLPDMTRQIIKALRMVGGQVGITKSECLTVVLDKFYPGRKRRDIDSTFRTAWTRVLEMTSASGDPVAVNPAGARYAIDAIALAGFEAPPQ